MPRSLKQRHEDGDRREDSGIQDGISEPDPDLLVFDNPLIGGQRPFTEVKRDAVILKNDRIDEGRHYDVKKRNDDGDDEDGEKDIADNRDGFVRCAH